ncbi:hypothetical protein BDD12DRAFT_336991 [Trichophaea hybrida]|nr:hypothetical protein BDD12DRAFT_336991 [Trichophaea hybrida]
MSSSPLHDRGQVPTLGPLIRHVEYSFLAVTALVVCARFYARARIVYSIGADDWCILFACMGLFITIGLHIKMTYLGMGKHSYDQVPSQTKERFIDGGMARLIYMPTSALIRISTLLFVRRLSPHRFVHYSTIILIVTCIFAAFSICVILLFRCIPVYVFFLPVENRPSNTRCYGSEPAICYAIPIVSVVLDFMVWLVPVVTVYRMSSLGWQKKLILIGVLGMGLLASIAAVIEVGVVASFFQDIPWGGGKMSLWVCVELGMGIIAASMPSLYPLVKMGVKRSRQAANEKFRSSSGNTPKFMGEGRGMRMDGLELPDLHAGPANRKFESSQEALHTVDEMTIHYDEC